MPATATVAPPTPKTETIPIGAYGSRYRFESITGVLRGLSCMIDWRPDWLLDPPDEPALRTQARVQLASWNRRYNDEEKALLEQAYLDNGSAHINFHYVRGPENQDGDAHTGHVWYATNSDAIAWVLRRYVELAKHEMSDFRFIHETARDEGQRLKVGDQVYATTEIGKKLAMEESLSSGKPIEPVFAVVPG